MPKSKRNKVYHTTQTKKKGKDHKEDLIKQLEQHLKDFNHAYLFDLEKTKSDRIMNLRLKLKKSGTIFAGRHSLAMVAFKSVGSKAKVDYTNFLKNFVGHRAILFTDLKCDQLIAKLDEEVPDFRDKLVGYSKLPNINRNKAKNSSKPTAGDSSDGSDGDSAGGEAESGVKTKIRRKKVVPPSEVEFILL